MAGSSFKAPLTRRVAHLGLLGRLDDDAVGGVVKLPGNYAEKLRLVLVAVVI